MRLPNEMLVEIFNYLPGKDLSRCRRVSRQWLGVADSFSEDYWHQTIAKDFPDSYQEAQRKSTLSWKDLYKSLSLWPKIQQAKLETLNNEELESLFTQEHEKKFVVLRNGVISFAMLAKRGFFFDNDKYDKIVYKKSPSPQYDNEEDGETYEFSFDENDSLSVLQGSLSPLYVIPKVNHKVVDVGEYLDEDVEEDYEIKQKFQLVKDRVYFRNLDKMLCVSTLVEGDGDITVNTEPLALFDFSIIAMTEVNDNQVNILTTRGVVYSLINKNIEFISSLHPVNRNIAKTLQSYGFEWSFKPIFKWLTSGRPEVKNAHITKLKNVTVFRQGKTVILGTSRRKIQIYDNPFDRDGNLKLYTAKPTRTIDLKLCYPSYPQQSQDIRQIDVVEIENGHRIIIMCNVVHKDLHSMYNCATIFIRLEFKHCPGLKRGAEGDENGVKRN